MKISPAWKRLTIGALVLALAAGGVWSVLAGRSHRQGGPDVPEGARPLLGCWTIVASGDERYPAGQSVCLHPDHLTVLTAEGAAYDGWRIRWSSEGGAEWRITVPPEETAGIDVHFAVGAAAGGGLAFRSGAGWVSVTLGERSPLRPDDVLERLRACRECVGAAIAASPSTKELVGGAPYALRACTMMARTVGRSTCDPAGSAR